MIKIINSKQILALGEEKNQNQEELKQNQNNDQ